MASFSTNTNNKVRVPPPPGSLNASNSTSIRPPATIDGSSAFTPQKQPPNQPAPIANSNVSSKTTTSNTKPPTKAPEPVKKTPLPPMVVKGKPYSTANLTKNTDPALGGETFAPPGCSGPQSYFNFYCKNTPDNTVNMKVIPWDHNKKDYVYTAVKDDDLRGYTKRDLKKRIDTYRDTDYWDPVSTYNLAYALSIGAFVLSLVVIIIYMIISWQSAKDHWYVLVAVPFVILIIGIIIVFAFRNRANKLTFQRKAALDDELVRYCRGNTTKIRTGEASSYLEVYQDSSVPPPVQTTAEPIKGSIASMNTKTSQKPVALNLMDGDDLNDSSTMKLNPDGRRGDREVSSSGIIVSVPPLSPMSQKKQSFMQRLENKKSNTPKGAANSGLPSMNYASVKPEQEMVFQPAKSINLMLDDDVLN